MVVEEKVGVGLAVTKSWVIQWESEEKERKEKKTVQRPIKTTHVRVLGLAPALRTNW